MPSLPPFFNGKLSGVLTLSISDISWFKNNINSTYVQFEWTGSQEKHKILTSKYSKITYDIRTSYKLFLNYMLTCTLKCSIKSHENKTLANASVNNLSMIGKVNQLVKIIPLMSNEERIGTLQLCFNLHTFNDTSFDYDIKLLEQYGIQNKVVKSLNDYELNYSDVLKNEKNRPISSSSFKSYKSKEELTSDYLLGKDMDPEEEEEALFTLRTMPSAEKIVSAAENISIYSPLHIEDNTNILTTTKPSAENMKEIQSSLKKSCKKLNKTSIVKDDVYLHLSVLSINVFRSIKSLQNYVNSTYIVQCLKDQEPCKSLRFISKNVENNVVKFKNPIRSSCLEGNTTKGITIKAYVRILSERSPIVLGETKQMLDWTEFSTILNVPRYIKVPIWNNDKIVGHLSLSYEFSKTPIVKNYIEKFSEKYKENIIEKKDPEKSQCKLEISKSVPIKIEKNKNFKDSVFYPIKNQMYLYNRLYPENNYNIFENQLLDEWSKKESTKATKVKGTQTNVEGCQFNKSVQTLIKTFNVAIQVDSDELEDPLDKTFCCDVQNIFRCTHEFTFNIGKNCNSAFNYVTYQFPECVTNNLGKVISCCRMFRTFGNTNILHLVTLPTTTNLETYFNNHYKRAAVILNLHQLNDFSSEKVSLLVSDLVNMANEFKTTHITKKLILNNNLSINNLSHNHIHIIIHYKRVYHSFPFPEKQFKKSSISHKKLKKNSKNVIDLTESDSEDNYTNKTYTLLEHNDKFVGVSTENNLQTNKMPIKISHDCNTQTEKEIKQQCIIINDDINTTESKIERLTQTDEIIINTNQTNTKYLDNTHFCEFKNSNIFMAKITIVGGYNLPMVKLAGDTMPSAPTTYIIMEEYGGSNLSTSSVVQQSNPIWNSEWTVMIPKNKLIEEKWLIMELWCKKFKNEYAGHDTKRDKRLGFIFIDLCALSFNFNPDGELYDVISETEERHGKIKVIINQINLIDLQSNNNIVPQTVNKIQIANIKNENISQQLNDNSKNEILGKMNAHNNCEKTKKSTNSLNKEFCEYIDLTDDASQKLNEIPFNNTDVKNNLKKCYSDNDNILDKVSKSSVTSWTSSSDDILFSNNSRLVNNILCDESKINRIKHIILS